MLNKRDMIQRLSQYRSVLQKLKGLGLVRVFSDNLADALGISASLARKDLAQLQLSGQKRGGYQVDPLLERLNEILGKHERQRLVIAGCGKIGRALIDYNNFRQDDIQIVAGFDVDPNLINTAAPVPIHDVAELGDFVRREQIEVAIIATPDNAAGRIFEQLKESGVRGVLNFAPVQLKSSEACVVQNLHLREEIEQLFYLVHFMKRHNGAPETAAPAPKKGKRK
ncbi:MAG: redox-sensing transcriptional repressor Rex [Candidatus Marinimicrobia bacterium]|nr:redox-sensing transcriptional repressor Rex [Candidatus Neomarinimicrobiota bacterium]